MNSDQIVEAIAQKGTPATGQADYLFEQRPAGTQLVGAWAIQDKLYAKILNGSADAHAWDDYFGLENFRGYFYI